MLSLTGSAEPDPEFDAFLEQVDALLKNEDIPELDTELTDDYIPKVVRTG